jgi:hypothetical protein
MTLTVETDFGVNSVEVHFVFVSERLYVCFAGFYRACIVHVYFLCVFAENSIAYHIPTCLKTKLLSVSRSAAWIKASSRIFAAYSIIAAGERVTVTSPALKLTLPLLSATLRSASL